MPVSAELLLSPEELARQLELAVADAILETTLIKTQPSISPAVIIGATDAVLQDPQLAVDQSVTQALGSQVQIAAIDVSRVKDTLSSILYQVALIMPHNWWGVAGRRP
jgi:hypothetical protein